jgi:hypothetical protein
MLEPGRSYNSSSYRYSINGQEKETELNENITTAEFWEYDSRIVRRWNVDPVYKEFMSNYAAFGDNPIMFVDPDGADWYRKGDKTIWNSIAGHNKRLEKQGYKYLGAEFEENGKSYDKTGEVSNILNVVVVTSVSLNRPPKLDVNYTERINYDLRQLGIHPDQLRDRLNKLLPGGSPDLKDIADKLRETEYGKAFSPVYDMIMASQKGSNSDLPMPPQLAALMKVPIRYFNNGMEEGDASNIPRAHYAGYPILTTYLSSYNTRWARSEYGGGFVALYVSKDNLIKMVANKAVVTANMLRTSYYQAYDGRTNSVYSYMIYMKKEQLANPIIDMRNIGIIPTNLK